MVTFVDDVGEVVPLPGDVLRIVSLVPSLTEALALSCREKLVGATDWCTHPADLVVARVRGTKNPDLEAIGRLTPDLVVANADRLTSMRFAGRGSRCGSPISGRWTRRSPPSKHCCVPWESATPGGWTRRRLRGRGPLW